MRLLPSGLAGAVQFLTRLPVRTDEAVPHHRTVPWFPVVGVLVGAAVGGLAIALGEVLPLPVAATVAVVAGLLITGAFHEDGLADVADAFGGGWDTEQRFEILKDSRHGTYGVAALSGSILLRTVAAASIVGAPALFAGFVTAHTLGRVAVVLVLAAVPSARSSGLGVDAARELRPVPLTVGVLWGVAVVVAVAGWWSVVLVGVGALGAVAMSALAVRKIGGVAGDVLGAVEQVVECVVLVAVAGLAARHSLWWAA